MTNRLFVYAFILTFALILFLPVSGFTEEAAVPSDEGSDSIVEDLPDCRVFFVVGFYPADLYYYTAFLIFCDNGIVIEYNPCYDPCFGAYKTVFPGNRFVGFLSCCCWIVPFSITEYCPGKIAGIGYDLSVCAYGGQPVTLPMWAYNIFFYLGVEIGADTVADLPIE